MPRVPAERHQEGGRFDLERQASVFLNITEHLVKGVIGQSGPKHLAAVAVAVAVAVVVGAVRGALYWRQRKHHESPRSGSLRGR